MVVDGVEHVIATTQFQSTDARRAFPCFDEPDLKATFGVSLVVPEDLLAISNGAQASRTPLGDGTDRVVFVDTIPLSTYLVAFVVGPLEATEPVDGDGVPVLIVHPPGRAHQTAFALEVATHSLRWFADWYDLEVPGGKVDLVALPDFAFGDYWDEDIANHPADYKNMVEACVEDILYDNGVESIDQGEQSYLDGDENYGSTYEQSFGW